MAKKKVRVRQNIEDDIDYKEMIDQDRMADMSSPEVTPFTDDQGNPLATKDTISMAKTKSEQTISDFRALQDMKNRREVEASMADENTEERGYERPKKSESKKPGKDEKRKKFLIQLSKYSKEKVKEAPKKKNMGEPNDATYAAAAQQEAMSGNLEDAFNTMQYGIEKPKRKVSVKRKSK